MRARPNSLAAGLAFAGASAAAGAACSFDLSGYREDVDAAPPLVEAGGDGPATSDASAPEASGDEVPAVGPSDGAPGASPCTVSHEFCDDFDHGNVGDTWSSVEFAPGEIALDSNDSVSSPRSLNVQTPRGDEMAVLNKNVVGAVRSFHYAFDWKLDALDTNGAPNNMQFAVLTSTSPTVRFFSVTLHMNDGHVLVQEYTRLDDGGDGPVKSYDTGPVTVGRWMHFDVDCVIGGLLVVQIDGTTVVSKATTSPATTDGSSFQLGPSYGYGGATWKMHYDNLTIDVTR